ncbi:MAG: DNA polymerase I, partial [Bacteroidales bacterium]|nr:DNA polymerase I [Bacteroidales bacterium]
AKQAAAKGLKVYMMTPDKDFVQLVEENIKIYKPGRKGKPAEILGVWEIRQKYGIQHPEQVIDILALWGDAADNIPGIAGVGEKKASKLIAEYGSVEKIYENIDKIKGKMQENLLAGKEQIKLSKELVTIALDVPVEFDEELFSRKEKDKEKLQKVFEDLEFRTMGARVVNSKAENTQAVQGTLFDDGQTTETTKDTLPDNFANIRTTEHRYLLVEDKKSRIELIKKLSLQKEFCFDTETTGLEFVSSEIIGIAFSFKEHEAYYLNLPEDFQQTKLILEEFKEVFENQNIEKIGQNIKYDILMLKNYGIEIKGKLFDTMLAHYLLQPEQPHNFNYLAETYLNYKTVKIEELIGTKGKSQLNMRQISAEKVKEYAGEDADLTYQLKKIFEIELKKSGMNDLAYRIEMPLVSVLADMEFQGVKIDSEFLNKYADELRMKIITIEKEIFKLAGMEFNIASPKQLGEVLFDRLKIISQPKKTKTGQYATGEQELVKLKDKHEIIEKILDYRGLQKLLNTYVAALPKLVSSKSGKLHTSFNQAAVATGRLSSSNPNLQNIPIRTVEGREIRKAFVPSLPDTFIFSADYSQIELRIMAHMSGDEQMIEAFKENEDIHTATAAKIFNVSIDEVSREMRSKAKSANFGIIYGISSFGLAQNLGIKRSEAKELIDNYFKTYPKVKEYMSNQVAKARELQYVETLFGRRRYLKDIDSRNSVVRSVAERNAINAPIQGTAADIIKLAMINIFSKLQENNLKTKMVLQVHDELVFEVPKNELEQVQKIVHHEMENAVKLSVPLIADSGYGKNWLEAH